MDPDFAKFLRIPVLVIATALIAFGSIVMGLAPGSLEADYYFLALRLCIVGLAFLLLWVAGWLRSQEASDPTTGGKVSKSVLRHFLLYALISLGISSVIAAVVLR